MLKSMLSALSLIAVITISAFSPVNAATFSVTRIGALDLGGHTYPEWWYTGTNPVISGTGAENTEVTVTVGDQSFKANADGSGNWSISTTMAEGEHNITVTQGSNSYAFKLHIGQDLPENLGGTASQASQSTMAVPNTGFNQIAGIGFGLGVALLASYFYISGDVDRRALFEKRIIKESK